MEVMYEKINSGEFTPAKVQNVISSLKEANLFEQRYTNNLEARMKVHDFITTIAQLHKK